MFKKIGIVLILLVINLVVKAQDVVYELPIYYGQFFNDPQINTLGFESNEGIKLSLAHRRNSNNFGGINTSMFAGQFKLKSKNDKAYHSLGMIIVSDKEGFLIRRNRASINYGRHLKMNEKFNIAGGFSAGFYNFSIVSNEVTGGYSNYAFDGSFSLSLYNETTKIGLNLNQITNSTIRPVDQDIVLARHLNVFASHQFKVGEEVDFIPSLMSRYSKKSTSVFSGFSGSASFQFLFSEKFMAGVSLEKGNGLYFFGGVENIAVWNSLLDVNPSYFVPNGSNQRSNVQLFEVFIAYKINSKNNKDRGVTSID